MRGGQGVARTCAPAAAIAPQAAGACVIGLASFLDTAGANLANAACRRPSHFMRPLPHHFEQFRRNAS